MGDASLGVDARRAIPYLPATAGGCIAQLVEQLTLNQRVHGSSPCAPTNTTGGFIKRQE